MSKITGVSQTQFWGCCGQERLGAIYLQITENGERYINCKEAVHLIDGISAEVLLADRGYDTNDILAHAVSVGMQTVIPPKKDRREQRKYDQYLYKLRHLAENRFLVLKRWRGIATRYAKTSDAVIAAVQIRCIAIWAAIRA